MVIECTLLWHTSDLSAIIRELEITLILSSKNIFGLIWFKSFIISQYFNFMLSVYHECDVKITLCPDFETISVLCLSPVLAYFN